MIRFRCGVAGRKAVRKKYLYHWIPFPEERKVGRATP
jgi:hypothetical protein